MMKSEAWLVVPAPSGKHCVGRVSFHYVDPKRLEVETETDDDKLVD